MIYSIGHSNLSRQAFLELIAPVDVVIDVRSHPGSIHVQFDIEELKDWLPRAGKQYEWEPRLGGWRAEHLSLADQFLQHDVDVAAYAGSKFPKQRIAKKRPAAEPAWTNYGLWDYSFFMTLPEFMEAAKQIAERGAIENIGLMCCEVLWWKCHRSMIADYLVFRGFDMMHLQPRQTLHSTVIGYRLDRYDQAVQSAWDSF